jgi:NADH-quinone oxidoreductase subunit E
MAVLSTELRAKAEEIKGRYPDARSAMMPLLYLVQSVEGHVSREGLQEVADILELRTAEVEAVATFYTMIRLQPTGQWLVSVCTNLSCALLGGRRLYERAAEELGPAASHGATEDGVFSLHEEECLGACDAAPLVQIDVANHDRVTRERLLEMIEQLRRGETPAPSRGAAPRDYREASRILAGVAESGESE